MKFGRGFHVPQTFSFSIKTKMHSFSFILIHRSRDKTMDFYPDVERKVVVGSAVQKHGFIFNFEKGNDSSSSEEADSF